MEGIFGLISLEHLCVALLAVYLLNFVHGRARNLAIVRSFEVEFFDLFQSNFSTLSRSKLNDGGLASGLALFSKQSQSEFRLYASGRRHCTGAIVQLDLIRRHDLLSLLAGVLQQVDDRVVIEVPMREASMPPFVFAVTRREGLERTLRDCRDVSVYCRQVPLEFLPKELCCFTDCEDLVTTLLTPPVAQVLCTSVELVECIHFSDSHQSSLLGANPRFGEPKRHKALRFVFRMPRRKANLKEMRRVIELVFACVDKVGETKLSSSARNKAERLRRQELR